MNALDQRIVLVTRHTRLEDLVVRFNTIEQARFYVEHLGADFSDYAEEHRVYQLAVQRAETMLARFGRVQRLDRGFLAFSRCREGFDGFAAVLWARLQSMKSLFGIHRLVSGPDLSWSTIVDLSQECIRGFSTPDLDRPDTLQSFLDADKHLGRRASELLDRDPLFIPVRR
ncbi:hypothetical protein [Frateuria defendens]|uniref:hypothetical protein n=1 Tax=Frateuria defendens TaxID=2219559 RepID=UPI00066FDC1C|nr:hypothetical protein [Frateuria defendens]